MSHFPQSRPFELEYGTDNKVVFNFFNTVYAWMAVGLAVTAVVAYGLSQLQLFVAATPGWSVAILVGAVLLSMAVQQAALRLNPAIATVLFLIYAALIGAVIAPIFVVYKIGAIVSSFLVTGGAFAGLSIYGYVTKRDLSGMRGILIMAAIGIFVGALVNIFWASNIFSWIITYAVLALSIGMTIYHTQQLRIVAVQFAHDPKTAARYAIIGSLILYISFINMFMSILRILNDRR